MHQAPLSCDSGQGFQTLTYLIRGAEPKTTSRKRRRRIDDTDDLMDMSRIRSLSPMPTRPVETRSHQKGHQGPPTPSPKESDPLPPKGGEQGYIIKLLK